MITFLRSSVLTIVLGLTLGAIVHLAAVLSIPRLGQSSAYQRIAAIVPTGRTVLIDEAQGATRLRFADPSVQMSACTFDLADGPMRISVVTRDLVQSLSIHGETGGVLYAVSDRSAVRGGITFTLLTQRQLDALEAREEEPVDETRLAFNAVRGLVIVRAHAVFPSQGEQARALVSSLSCQRSDT